MWENDQFYRIGRKNVAVGAIMHGNTFRAHIALPGIKNHTVVFESLDAAKEWVEKGVSTWLDWIDDNAYRND